MPSPDKPVAIESDIVETDFPVRYAETDAMGVVHHASYQNPLRATTELVEVCNRAG